MSEVDDDFEDEFEDDGSAPEITCDEVFGVGFEPRGGEGSKDRHVCVTLHSGDDGHYRKIASYSSFWLDMLISSLIAAKAALEADPRFEKDPKGWGWRYKKQK